MSRYIIDDKMSTRLASDFQYHSPKDNQPERFEKIRGKALELAVKICENVPPSREQSIALTKLEEAVMWANAAIARNE